MTVGTAISCLKNGSQAEQWQVAVTMPPGLHPAICSLEVGATVDDKTPCITHDKEYTTNPLV